MVLIEPIQGEVVLQIANCTQPIREPVITRAGLGLLSLLLEVPLADPGVLIETAGVLVEHLRKGLFS